MSWTETVYRNDDGRIDVEPRFIPSNESDLLKIRGGDGSDYDITKKGDKFIVKITTCHSHEESFNDFNDVEDFINFDYYSDKEYLNLI